MTNTPLVSDFTAGELSPFLYGMSQHPVYNKGASVVKNFVPKEIGGFYKRPGTLVCGHTITDSAANLVPFIVNQTTAYVLEFTNNLIRAWKDGVLQATIWGGNPTQVTTYTAAEIPYIQTALAFPDLFITHQNHPPARIRWTTPNTLTYSNLAFSTNTITFTADLTNTSATILNVKNSLGVPSNLFPLEATWILTGTGVPANTYLQSIAPTLGSSPLAYQAVMNNAASATNLGVALTLTLQPTVFGSAGNYPRACQVSFQRLWLMNTINQPQTIWQSAVGIYSDSTDTYISMQWSDITTYPVPTLQTNADGSPTTNPPTYISVPQFQDQVDDGNAGEYTINSPRDDEIYWGVPIVDMLIGTAYGEWIVPATSGPNTFAANQISAVSDYYVPPALVSGGVLLIQKLGKRVIRIDWQGASNPFPPPQDLTFFAEHLFMNNPIVDFDLQITPDCLLWYMRTDGTIAVLVYNHAVGIIAWWNWVTRAGDTVLSLCSVPGPDLQGVTDRDVLYLCIQRGTSVFIEQVATPYWTDNRKAVLSDCATYKYNAVAFTTMTIDAGLVGKTLEVVADGAYIGTVTPTTVTLTLPLGRSANYAVAGLNYISQVTSLPLVSQTAEGSNQLKKKAIPRCRFRVLNALYMKAGQFTVANASGLSPLSKVQMGDTAIDYTKANPTPYSGYCRSSILEALRDDAYLSIVSDLPLPLSVTGIVPDVEDVEST